VVGNPRIKEARKLGRRSVRTERRLFLADGPKAVQAALEVEGCVVEVFATVEATNRYSALRAAAETVGAPWVLVDDRALASLSDSVTPAGVVAVCHFLDVPLSSLVWEGALAPVGSLVQEGALAPVTRPRGPSLVAICADIRDPGNAGTVIRTADAAGADGVVLAGSSVDAYNPKTVRASVGSLFHLPVVVEPDVATAVAAARSAGLTVLAADGAGEVLLDAGLPSTADLLGRRTAWLFGNEAWGLPADVAALADQRVRIPIHGRAESLNLSTAAALCMYASASAQRRPGSNLGAPQDM
jgi:RNA methyltransferase, TrmH family